MATAEKSAASNLEPSDDWIVVQETTPANQTRGGILLPDQAKQKTSLGVVLAAGPGKTCHETGLLHPMPYKRQDVVLFGEWTGAEVEIYGEKLRFLRASDVMSKVNCK